MPKAIEMTHPEHLDKPYYMAMPKGALIFVLDLNQAHILDDDINDQEFVDMVKKSFGNDDLRKLNIRIVRVVDNGDTFSLASELS